MAWILPNGSVIINPCSVTIDGTEHAATIFAKSEYWEPLGIHLFIIANSVQAGRKPTYDDVLDESAGTIVRTFRNDEWTEGFEEMRYTLVKQTKEKAGDLIKPYDWYYLRKVRTGADVPETVDAYCTAVTEACDAVEAALAAVESQEDLMAVAPAADKWWPDKPAI